MTLDEWDAMVEREPIPDEFIKKSEELDRVIREMRGLVSTKNQKKSSAKYYHNNREKCCDRYKEYSAKPENKERHRQAAYDYYLRNKQALSEKKKAAYQRKKEAGV